MRWDLKLANTWDIFYFTEKQKPTDIHSGRKLCLSLQEYKSL